MAILRWCAALALVWILPDTVAAQAWGDPGVADLIRRAIARREATQSDPDLARWEARARGLVMFLSRLGGAEAAERLVKADELDVEVYWEAPGPGKQRIVAWRDRAWLPTDIQYHRDHLGIITNDFGPVIRLGEGEEVRDVLHPLGTAGVGRYEFALADSLVLQSDRRSLTVHRVLVRPRDLAAPGIVGTLYLEAETGALARFRFSFTPASYRDATIEDISVVLENALQGGRYWLPWRQSIEIRRRAGIVDLPVRGVIRAEWQLGDHRVGGDVVPRAWTGPLIGGLATPGGPAGHWEESLEARLARRAELARPLDRADLMAEVRTLAEGRLGGHGPPARLAVGRLSDLVRVNRVEGVRLGLGIRLETRHLGGLRIAPWLGYGVASDRLTGRLAVARALGASGDLTIGVAREVEDLAGQPPISGPLNSILAQEFGVDRGDWVDHEQAWVSVRHQAAGGMTVRARLAVEEWHQLGLRATPTRGTYRPNPDLSAGRLGTLRVEVEKRLVPGAGAEVVWRTGVEGGTGNARYVRLDASADATVDLGSGAFSSRVEVGLGSAGLPAPRQFALGGWGTLPGVPYRAHGGRWSVLGRLEYLLRVPVPELQLGTFASTGSHWRAGPFVAVGAAGGTVVAGSPPWPPSGGVHPVVGLAVEAFWRLIRVELGVALRGGRTGASADIARPWWSVL